ncbi:MAG: hypothetical protein WBY53_18305 [Acidobacteriaceae bacterium]
MTPQDWESPGTIQAPAGVAGYGSGEAVGIYTLRPLSTGEVLDRTFAIYRANFWLFAGLASLSGAFSLVVSAVQMMVHHVVLLHHGIRAALLEMQGANGVTVLLMLPVTAVVYAASVYALGEVYLGRGTTAKAALNATMGNWLRYVGIGVWQGWSAIWLFLLVAIPGGILLAAAAAATGLAVMGVLLVVVATIGGGVYGVIAYIRNSLGIPAALMEGTGVRASMRRSKTLAAGTKGRIFVVLLIALALYLVFGAIESPMLFFIGRAPFEEHVVAQAAVLLIGFVAHILVSPVALIGLTLVYFDQRVRMEAFDLVMMMGDSAPVAAEAWTPAPVVTAAAPEVAATAEVAAAEEVETPGVVGSSEPGGEVGRTVDRIDGE